MRHCHSADGFEKQVISVIQCACMKHISASPATHQIVALLTLGACASHSPVGFNSKEKPMRLCDTCSAGLAVRHVADGLAVGTLQEVPIKAGCARVAVSTACKAVDCRVAAC